MPIFDPAHRANRLAGLFDPATVVIFAGIGGVCIGVEQAYVEGGYQDRYIDLAINHWKTAVDVHELNHPNTQHLQADVWEVDPNSVLCGRRIGYLHLSPDCTDFSKAKGGAPKRKHIRALADVGLVWAGKRRPDVITLENVEEFKDWGPLTKDGQPDKRRRGQEFQRWKRELEDLGYNVEHRELRACDYGAPTTRKRLFVIARCDGKPIIWPEATHGSEIDLRRMRERGTDGSRGGSQLAQAANVVRAERRRRDSNGVQPGVHRQDRAEDRENRRHNPALKPYRTAAECIDWNQPMLSIFATRPEAREWAKAINAGRKKQDRVGVPQRPLKPKTQQRIAGGLEKWVLKAKEPFIVNIANYGWDSSPTESVSRPMSTVTSGPRGGKHAAVDVELATYSGTFNHDGAEHRTSDLREPMTTVTAARDARGVVGVFTAGVGGRAGQSPATSATAPMPTVTGKADRVVVGASLSPFTIPRHGERDGQAPRSRSIDKPLPTITGTDNGAQLVAVAINKHFGGVVGQSADAPLGTVTGIDHNSVLAAHLTTFHSPKGNETRGQGLDEPLRTLDTQNRYGAVACYLSHQYTSNTCGGCGDPGKPAKTITSGGQHAAVNVVYLQPFYASGSGKTGHTPAHPLPTITAQDRFSVVSLDATPHWVFSPAALHRARQVGKWALKMLGKKAEANILWVLDKAGKRFPLLFLQLNGAMHLVTDIAMRMLRPRELARAQGFPDWYVIDRDINGKPVSKANQVKLIGNSVPPQFAHAIAKANVVDAGVMDETREAVSA